MHVVDRIVVSFDGDGSGVDELAWGQAENWSAIVRQKTWIPLGGVRPLPEGTTVDDITDEVSYLMGRFQAIRTRLRFDSEGRPTQVVSSFGEITINVIDAGADDPAEVADRTRVAYGEADLDFTNEWPVRLALIRHGDALTHLVMLVSHFVTDAAGGVTMMTDVATRSTAPVTGTPPLEQARWQHSPAGRRQNEAALRYWERVLRSIDTRRFDYPADPVEPRYWLGEFNSPAMAPAVRAIADRTGLESASILLGIFAMALAPLTGINPVVVRPLVSNRFRPGLGEVVCTLAQAGLCALDVVGAPFDETLERVAKASLTAYKYGYFHPGDMVELRERIAKERGSEIDIGCYFNDRRMMTKAPLDGPPPTAEQAREALPRTTFRWLASQDGPAFEPLFVHIDDVPGTVAMTINLDSHALSPSDGEALLRGMETVAIAGAFGPLP